MNDYDKICYIFAAGQYDDAKIDIINPNTSLIIAADGGYEYLKSVKILPSLVVGDFDSLGYIPKEVKTKLHPSEKDETDLMLAVNEGFAAGYKQFIIYGALGGRLDHTIANIQLLSFISEQGGRAVLCNNDISIAYLLNGTMHFSADYKGVISIFCIGRDAECVTISGLKYEVNDITVTAGYPLGISNEFIGKEADISVLNGGLIIIYENQDK